jgi:hypothetical protein
LKPDGVTPYTDAQIAAAALDSFSIDSFSIDSFSIVGDTQYFGHPRCSHRTIYSVGLNPDGTAVIYSEGGNDGLTTIPEPSSFSLLTMAALGSMWCTLRRRQAYTN